MGLLRADLYKLARHALLRWLAVALLTLVALRGIVWPPDPTLPWAGVWSYSLILTALVMLAAVAMGQEFSEDTLRSLVSRGVPRWGLLLSKFVALILVGALLLVVTEGLAVLLGVRSELHWDDMTRAWSSMWPYVSLTMLLTLLARNGGLALVVGVMLIVLESIFSMFLAGMAALAGLPGWEFITPQGTLGAVAQWSLYYNALNWTYQAEWLRAPMPANVLMSVRPRPAVHCALILVAITLIALGLSLLVVYRRDVTEVVTGKKRLFGLVRGCAPHKGKGHLGSEDDRLPRWTAKGPLLARLVRAHLFKMGQTSLVRIGVAVALLFPLALWGAAAATKAVGFEETLFSPGPDGGIPWVFMASLLMVGPLTTMIGILAISNELTLGTRRAELTRGVTRMQGIVAQSLALVMTLCAVFAFLMTVTLLIGMNVSGSWFIKDAVQVALIGTLASGAYLAAPQLGGALTRSPLGVMLFGLGFLLIDWLAILAPTVNPSEPGILPNLVRFSIISNAFSFFRGKGLLDLDAGWEHFSAPSAFLLLLGYTVAGHALAIIIARRRDA